MKLNNLNPLKLGRDKEERLSEVDELAEGNGIGYKASDMTVVILIPIVLLILSIMLCGYFFIYNVFDIAVMKEIRRYGLYRTIGMSRRQVKSLINGQALRLYCAGTPAFTSGLV